MARAFRDCILERIPFDETARIRNAEKNIVTVRTIGEAVMDSMGNVIRLQGGLYDITRLKEAEEMIVLQSAALSAAENMIVITTISPLLGRKKTVTNFIVVKEDVTEKRKIENQLSRAERLDSLGALAGGISHDLNNILTPIIMGLGGERGQDSDASGGSEPAC